MSRDGKKSNSLINDSETLGLINRDEIPEKYKECSKNIFGLENLKTALELLEKFDVDEIEIVLADKYPILFFPIDRKIGIAVTPRIT